MTDFITLRKVSKMYRRGGEELRVLDQLDLEIPRTDFVGMYFRFFRGEESIVSFNNYCLVCFAMFG